MPAYTLLFLCASVSHAARVKLHVAKSDAHNNDANSSGVIQQGMLLRGRYRLDEYSHSHHRATPGDSFPSISSKRSEFTGAEHLGTGSFGDVWKAWDTQLNSLVAVKIFYQGKRYMTWHNADARGKRELKDSAEECTFVTEMLKNRNKYPLGASRICECYREHINDASNHDVVFLVQEMCGRDLETQFIKPRRQSGRVNAWKARQVTKQMLQGIAFLQMFNPPLIHHDLKPANVCMNDQGQVKIIDWGGIVQGKISNMYKPAVATPLYTPPEAKSRVQSFASPFWSYDLYALGLMHMELVCPKLDIYDWYQYIPLDAATFKHVINSKCKREMRSELVDGDVEIMASLAAKRASDRPDPMSFLDHEALKDVPTPQVQEEEKAVVLIYKPGQEVEYWSTTYKEWMAAIIGDVHHDQGTYDLLNPSAYYAQKFTDDSWLRKGADPDRVRMPKKMLDASVNEDFIPHHSRVNANDAEGIENPGLLIPIQPVKEAPKKPVGGNEGLPHSTEVELERPSLYGSARTGYIVQTYVRGLYLKSVDSVTLLCEGIEDIAFQVKLLGVTGTLYSAKLDLAPGDQREGNVCKAVAIATLKKSGQDERKVMAYPQVFGMWK